MGYHAYRLKARSVISFLCILAVVAVGLVLIMGENQLSIPAWNLLRKGPPGGTEQERMAFLSANGWEAEETPLAATEVTIPATFDETYEQYNALQQSQGFDLQKLAGKKAMEYTYHVTNYPDNPDVAAHLLVYQDKIVGADLSAMEQGGFIAPVKQKAAG